MALDIAFGTAIYFLIWWIVLFVVLPIGVHTQNEQGKVVPGSTESAPVRPHFLTKIIGTTLLAALVFGVVYLVVFQRAISIDDIPFLPRYETIR